MVTLTTLNMNSAATLGTSLELKGPTAIRKSPIPLRLKEEKSDEKRKLQTQTSLTNDDSKDSSSVDLQMKNLYKSN